MQRARVLWDRYGRHAPAVALLVGFIFDSLTLTRPDQLFANATIVGYLVATALLFTLLQSARIRARQGQLLAVRTVLQFSLGNLASGLLVLYIKSGALAGSLIFAAVLVALLVANEFLKHRYERALVTVSVWYVLLLTYVTIALPIALGIFGDSALLAGVSVSLVVVGSFILILHSVAPSTARYARGVLISVTLITATFVGLYYTSNIPPVPLIAKEIGVYHSVVREGGVYNVAYEQPHWYQFWRDTATTYTLATSGEPAYCFSAIYAPAGLSLTLYHVWEYRDTSGVWHSASRVPITLTGGRESGYRAYSYTTQLTHGTTWRCSAATERGAVVGRTVVEVQAGTPQLTESIL